MAVIGILGVGGLAELMLRGFAGSGHRFILSPRGAKASTRLAMEFGHQRAANNQDVIDRSDAVFVSLPADSGAEELSGLRFRAGQPVLSAIAGTGLRRLAEVAAPARACVGMMPGYANAFRLGPCILCPQDDFWQGVLSAVGPVHVFEDEKLFTAAATFGAFSGATIGWMASIINWFEAQGLPAETARALVAGTLRGNAEVLLQEPRPLSDIAKGVTTPGGITLQLLDHLERQGALSAWADGLDLVLRRINSAG